MTQQFYSEDEIKTRQLKLVTLKKSEIIESIKSAYWLVTGTWFEISKYETDISIMECYGKCAVSTILTKNLRTANICVSDFKQHIAPIINNWTFAPVDAFQEYCLKQHVDRSQMYLVAKKIATDYYTNIWLQLAAFTDNIHAWYRINAPDDSLQDLLKKYSVQFIEETFPDEIAFYFPKDWIKTT